MIVRHEEGPLVQRAIPGVPLYYISKMPEGAPRAMVGLLHGYADHANRYTHVMGTWALAGVGSVAIDMRGHGRAGGHRGACRRFDEYLDDAAELARLVADRARGAPTFLMGHSFGGLVAAASVLEAKRNLRGLLLSAPFLGLAMPVPPAKVMLGRLISRLVPRLALPNGLDGSMVTHDADVAKAYDSDPLSFHVATARWFTEGEKMQARVVAKAPELTLPLYMLFGGADPIASVTVGRRFFDRAGSKDKTWDERPGLYHECLSEPEWPEVAKAMLAWIDKRAGS